MAFTRGSEESRNNVPNGYPQSAPLDSKKLTTSGLKSLQSLEEKRLFDVVDKVREFDINREIDLPQLVVCGSQSSGKSSVLEAISQVPFPRAEMTCTRFVTEIRFRRSNTKSIQVSILPDSNRDAADRARLEQARLSATHDLNQLPALVKEAEKLMGLAGRDGFAKDVLRVQITGPDQQPLTLVDLPGLIESHSQGQQSITMIKSIVDSWISEKRSIILAVVEANNDAQKQGVLTRAKLLDPDGDRTFGIITKPDLSGDGSYLQKYWINHARNTRDSRVEFNFKRGWHVLLNRNFKEMGDKTTSDMRDDNERKFFQDRNNNWSVIDPANWGIDSLRYRLNRLLYEHTKRQLPIVRREIVTKLDDFDRQIDVLEARLQKPDQLWKDFQRECKAMVRIVTKGVDGKFNDHFFSDYTQNAPLYLRSRIEEENDAFYAEIHENGHGIRFPHHDSTLPDGGDQWADEVNRVLSKTMGEELPGHTDPQRLDFLFWKHSNPWHGIALAHVDQAHRHCEQFIDHLISVHLHNRLPSLPVSVTSQMADALRKSLKVHKDAARKELQNLEDDRRRSTKTRNKVFVEKSQQARHSKLHRLIFRAVDAEEHTTIDLDNRDLRMTPRYVAERIGQEAGASTAENLAIDMLTYYNIARDVFIDNVVVQVIERHLLAELHTLFYSDFDIDHSTFLELLNDDDYKAREDDMKALEDRRRVLQTCLDELSTV